MRVWKRLVSLCVVVPLLGVSTQAAMAKQTVGDVATSVATSAAATGSNPQLVASYDFTGGSTKDQTGSYDMTLEGGAKVEAYGDRSNNEALSLRGSGQYAQLPDSLFKDLGNSFTMTFAAKSRTDDTGKYFSFSVGKDSSRYLFWYLSTKSTKLVISDNQWNNEQGFKKSLANGDNIWHDFTIAVDGQNIALYRDNVLVGFKANTGITMSDLGSTAASFGKPLYNGDSYWNGAIDDIKIYKGAQLKAPTDVAISGDAVKDGRLSLSESDTTQLKVAITPSDAVSTAVSWESSDESIAKVDSQGTVTAVAPGEASITATSEIGGASASIPVTVTALDPATAAQADVDAAMSTLSSTTTENLPLVAKGARHGSSIVWTSSDAKVISGTDTTYKAPKAGAGDPYQGAGVITRPAYGDGDAKPVTLTATATYEGVSVMRDITVTVKEKPRTAPDAGYAAATFKGDNGDEERIWMSSTKGNDFFSFATRNNGDPVLANDADTGGLRDAYILRSHGGDKYYMIATDLKVYADGAGWGNAQQYGSSKVEVYESKDLMNWTRTNGDGHGGITINTPDAGMTWAPEAYWDDDLQAYVVFFSSRMYTDATRTTPTTSSTTGNSSYSQVRYSITRDFVNFTTPQTWQDTGYSRIDSTVFRIGGYYYRLTKNEEDGAAGDYVKTGKSIFLERSKVLTAETTTSDPDQDPATGWQLLEDNLLPFEGPETVKLNKSDPINTTDDDGWVLLSDNFSYRAFMTTGSQITATTWANPITWRYPNFNNEKSPVTAAPGAQGFIAAGAEGGLPSIVRHGAFVNVPQSVLDVMSSWTTEKHTSIKNAAATVSARYNQDSRKLTADVAADDHGSVAGSVTFSVPGWSTTVKLTAKTGVPDTVGRTVAASESSDYQYASADVVVPDSVEGSVSVTYNGYEGVDGSAWTHDADSAIVIAKKDNNQPDNGNGTDNGGGNPGSPAEGHSNGAGADAADARSHGILLGETGVAVTAVLAVAALVAAVGMGAFLWRRHRA